MNLPLLNVWKMNNLNYEKVFETLVRETKDYLHSNNLRAMVLGISGGIDSTVVAAICREVSDETGIPFIGRSLPIKNKNDEFGVSELVGNAFCDDFQVCPVTRLYHAALKEIYQVENMERHESTYTIEELEKANGQTPIANGNIQARLRMIYLYNLAGINRGLVMDTDNLTEHNLGFWTIHGDEGDFNPIGGLWKTEVYELAKYILRKYEDKMRSLDEGHFYEEEDRLGAMYKALIESIALTPTDGLGISNSDLEQIGAKSYKEVDDILQDYFAFLEISPTIEEGMTPKQMVDSYVEHNAFYDIPNEVIEKVLTRHINSEFKRKHRPIVISRNCYA